MPKTKAAEPGPAPAPDIRPDLIDRGIFVPEPKAKAKQPSRPTAFLTEGSTKAPEAEVEASYIGLYGDPVPDQSIAAAATFSEWGSLPRHVARVSVSGPTRGQLLDPGGPLFEASSLTKVNRQTGRLPYEFKAVPAAAYEAYVQYLKGRNRTFLRRAQELVDNG